MSERIINIRQKLERVKNLSELADLIFPDPKAMEASHLMTDLIGRIDNGQLTPQDVADLTQHEVDYQFMRQHENSPSAGRSVEDKQRRISEESKVIDMIAVQTGVSANRINKATEFWLSTTSND